MPAGQKTVGTERGFASALGAPEDERQERGSKRERGSRADVGLLEPHWAALIDFATD
jgi:hypothetical protein